MKLRLIKHWFSVALTCIALSGALLFLLLQNPEVNDYRPPYRSLWQAYFWVDETDFGWFGLEEWRLEGVNTETAIYFGKFQHYDIALSAPAVAAIGFAGIGTLGLLCFTGLRFLFHGRQKPPSTSLAPTATAP